MHISITHDHRFQFPHDACRFRWGNASCIHKTDLIFVLHGLWMHLSDIRTFVLGAICLLDSPKVMVDWSSTTNRLVFDYPSSLHAIMSTNIIQQCSFKWKLQRCSHLFPLLLSSRLLILNKTFSDFFSLLNSCVVNEKFGWARRPL